MHERAVDRPAITERRRGMRFPVTVPVDVAWREPSGNNVKETGQAREVNAQGGLLDMKTCPSLGTEVELTNRLSGESFRARVVRVRRSKEGNVLAVAVEFLVPSETFWGVNFQLKKTSAELVRLEQAIKTGTVDSRILTEFRDAVDYVRKTAWVVQEWQERQVQEHDPQTLLPLLTTERIRRATQLNKTITTGLEACEVTRDTAGIEDLFRAVQSLHQCVADLFKEPQS